MVGDSTALVSSAMIPDDYDLLPFWLINGYLDNSNGMYDTSKAYLNGCE